MIQTKKDRKKPGNHNSKVRDPRYDCLRAVAVMAIIMVHAMPVETVSPRQWWFNSIMTPFLLWNMERSASGSFTESVLLRWEFRSWFTVLFTIVIMSMWTEWFCLSGSMPGVTWGRC